MIGTERQLTGGKELSLLTCRSAPVALLQPSWPVHRPTKEDMLVMMGRDPKHYTEDPNTGEPELFQTKIHAAVHRIYRGLTHEVVSDESLVVASLNIYRSKFGLLVHQHPRPGWVEVYNRKFGDAPLFLPEQPLEMGELIAAAGQFV